MEVYDPLRRKNVTLTPEEEVRQSVISWLRDTAGVPVTHMESEYPFEYNKRNYRADILVFDRSLSPLMLVECKAPSVTLSTSVIDQVVRYTRVLKVKYILVTNGLKSHVLGAAADGGYEYLSAMPDLGF